MDHIDNTLRASVKALREVVAPAVDPTDPQARDQLKLVIDALEFARARVDLVPTRARLELEHSLALARELAAEVGSTPAGAALGEAITGAEATLVADARPSEADVRCATATLKAAVSLLAREDKPARGSTDRLILAATRRWAAIDRSWYLPLGFDPDPGVVPAIEDMLGIQSVTNEKERGC